MINARKLLSEYGLYAKKNYGQNFLIDNHVLNKIVNAADITKDDFVIEIGAGLGVLTAELCKRAGKVSAFEIDGELIGVLNNVLSPFDNVDIINEDILKANLSELLLANNAKTKNCKIVANLPYYITTPIIFNVFEANLPVKNMTVMVQKEVGLRMCASPSSKDYGALSIGVQYYSNVNLVANVPRNCFFPRPDIDSAVMNLNLYEKPIVEIFDKSLFFSIVKAAFSKRRKTLINCLSSFEGYSGYATPTKEQATNIIKACGFDENVRGEALNMEDFAKLSNEFFTAFNAF